jgi:hypothetical protein
MRIKVSVVEFVFRAHESLPPLAEPTTRIAEPEVRVQNDAIDAVITPLQQAIVALAQLVAH